MFVSHMAIQIELLELGESAEAEEADDLPPEVVAEVPLRPNPLEGPAVADAVRYRLKHAVDHVVGIGTGDRVRRLNFCSLFSIRSPKLDSNNSFAFYLSSILELGLVALPLPPRVPPFPRSLGRLRRASTSQSRPRQL